MTDETSPKSTEKSTVPVGALIPQPHGGALRNGGTSKGGTGRPPDAFRRLARNLLKNRKLMHRMADIADAKIGEIKTVLDAEGAWVKEYCETPLREQRGAFDSLAKIGIPGIKEASTEDVKKRLVLTLEVIRQELPSEQAEALIAKLEPIWR